MKYKFNCCGTVLDYDGSTQAGLECPKCHKPFDHKTFEVLRDIAGIIGTLDKGKTRSVLLNLEHQWLGEQGRNVMLRIAIFLTDDNIPCQACMQQTGPGGTEVAVMDTWQNTMSTVRICKKCVEKGKCWVTEISLNKENDYPPIGIG